MGFSIFDYIAIGKRDFSGVHLGKDDHQDVVQIRGRVEWERVCVDQTRPVVIVD